MFDSDNMSLWEKDINKAFEETKLNDSELFMNILSIVVFNRFNPLIGKLYKTINDLDKFTKILDDMSEQTFKFPSSQDFKDAMTLALVYYYKEIKGLNWVEVQKQFPYEKDLPIHYGKKLANINNQMKKHLDYLITRKEDDYCNLLTI